MPQRLTTLNLMLGFPIGKTDGSDPLVTPRCQLSVVAWSGPICARATRGMLLPRAVRYLNISGATARRRLCSVRLRPPADPPMHRRPVHPDARRDFRDIRTGQHRTNRVQTLPDNRQDNKSQPGLPEAPIPTWSVPDLVDTRFTRLAAV
jgi:hypothetical protein